MDLSPDGTPARFNFIFQVWRPAPNVTVTGCYSLVDDFISISIPIGIQPTSTINVARITRAFTCRPATVPAFEDVLGFYVESHGEFSDDPNQNDPRGDPNNGVELLTSGSYTSELVWYGSIGGATCTTQISRTAWVAASIQLELAKPSAYQRMQHLPSQYLSQCTLVIRVYPQSSLLPPSVHHFLYSPLTAATNRIYFLEQRSSMYLKTFMFLVLLPESCQPQQW